MDIEGVTENSAKLQNWENPENSPDHFSNRTVEEKIDHLEIMFESTPLSKNYIVLHTYIFRF